MDGWGEGELRLYLDLCCYIGRSLLGWHVETASNNDGFCQLVTAPRPQRWILWEVSFMLVASGGSVGFMGSGRRGVGGKMW